jgi:hypothetical protein
VHAACATSGARIATPEPLEFGAWHLDPVFGADQPRLEQTADRVSCVPETIVLLLDLIHKPPSLVNHGAPIDNHPQLDHDKLGQSPKCASRSVGALYEPLLVDRLAATGKLGVAGHHRGRVHGRAQHIVPAQLEPPAGDTPVTSTCSTESPSSDSHVATVSASAACARPFRPGGPASQSSPLTAPTLSGRSASGDHRRRSGARSQLALTEQKGAVDSQI